MGQQDLAKGSQGYEMVKAIQIIGSPAFKSFFQIRSTLFCSF